MEAFYLAKVTELIIPKNVTMVGYSAWSSASVQTIIFTGATPPTLTNLNNYYCSSLTHIYVPSGSVDAYKEALKDMNSKDGPASDIVTAMPDNFGE